MLVEKEAGSLLGAKSFNPVHVRREVPSPPCNEKEMGPTEVKPTAQVTQLVSGRADV